MYWAKDTRIPHVADFLTRNRYQQIGSKLHFADNEKKTDHSLKDFKFAMIGEHSNDVCSIIEKDPFLSIDEQIIPYKEIKSSLRQYLPKKSKKWGDKVFALCEQQCEVNGIRLAAVLWHDNAQVSLLSSFVGGQMVYQQQRYDRGKKQKIVDCPVIVMEYNKHMGYVDKFNRYIALYRSGQHCVTRHYLRFFPFHRCVLHQ